MFPVLGPEVGALPDITVHTNPGGKYLKIVPISC